MLKRTLKPIDRRIQLFVEGRSAEVFFDALLRNMGLQEIQVQNYGGNTELSGFLKALRDAPGFSQNVVASLGIIRDAETNPVSAFQSVCSALNGAEFPSPEQPETFTEGDFPRVAILILPDSETPGMLETLCLRSVANDPAMQCVEEYFKCAHKLCFFPRIIEKAQVQAFLASRPEAGLLLGEAANKGYWPWSNSAFDHIKQFLTALHDSAES